MDTPAPRLAANLAIGACQAGSLAASRTAFSLVALQFGAAPWLLGLMLALFGVIPAFATVHLGRWMDRLGTFPVVAVAILAALVALMQSTLALSLTSMLIAAPLIGTAAVLSHIGTTRILGAVDDPAVRARNLAYLALGYSMSQFVGPLVAGVVLDEAGARAVFAGIALLPAVAFAILLHGRASGAGLEAPGTLRESRGDVVELLLMTNLRRWLLLNGSFAAALTLFPFVVSLKAQQIGLTASRVGWLIGAAAFGSVVIRASVPLLVGLRPNIILAGAFAVTTLAYGGLAALSNFSALATVSFLLGLAVGVGMPIATTLIYAGAPRERISETLGLGMSISMTLQSIAPLLLGVLASSLGLGGMTVILCVVLCVAAAYAYREAPDQQKSAGCDFLM